MGRRAGGMPADIEGVRMKQQQPLSRTDLQDLHSVLRRAAERAERNRDFESARKLAVELAKLDEELAVTR